MSKVKGALQSAQRGIRAFHGSPHDFDRFDMSKIGTGEGAQAYGHGLYFAENEGVARQYRDQLAPKNANVNSTLARNNNDFAQAIQETQARIAHYEGMDPSPRRDSLLNINRMKLTELESQAAGNAPNPGRMYEVRINADPEQFLDWDKPLFKQGDVGTKARDAISNAMKIDAGGIYNSSMGVGAFSKAIKSEEMTAALREAGIPGIKYLDAGSRGAGDGTRNYVVFDDKLVEIIRKYGWAPGMAIPAGMALEIQQAQEESVPKMANGGLADYRRQQRGKAELDYGDEMDPRDRYVVEGYDILAAQKQPLGDMAQPRLPKVQRFWGGGLADRADPMGGYDWGDFFSGSQDLQGIADAVSSGNYFGEAGSGGPSFEVPSYTPEEPGYTGIGGDILAGAGIGVPDAPYVGSPGGMLGLDLFSPTPVANQQVDTAAAIPDADAFDPNLAGPASALNAPFSSTLADIASSAAFTSPPSSRDDEAARETNRAAGFGSIDPGPAEIPSDEGLRETNRAAGFADIEVPSRLPDGRMAAEYFGPPGDQTMRVNADLDSPYQAQAFQTALREMEERDMATLRDIARARETISERFGTGLTATDRAIPAATSAMQTAALDPMVLGVLDEVAGLPPEEREYASFGARNNESFGRTGPTMSTAQAREQFAREYLADRWAERYGVAPSQSMLNAAIGTFRVEAPNLLAGRKVDDVNPYSGALGLVQALGKRQDNLEAFRAASNPNFGNLRRDLDFFVDTTSPGTAKPGLDFNNARDFSRFQDAVRNPGTSIAEAVRAMNAYERPENFAGYNTPLEQIGKGRERVQETLEAQSIYGGPTGRRSDAGFGLIGSAQAGTLLDGVLAEPAPDIYEPMEYDPFTGAPMVAGTGPQVGRTFEFSPIQEDTTSRARQRDPVTNERLSDYGNRLALGMVQAADRMRGMGQPPVEEVPAVPSTPVPQSPPGTAIASIAAPAPQPSPPVNVPAEEEPQAAPAPRTANEITVSKPSPPVDAPAQTAYNRIPESVVKHGTNAVVGLIPGVGVANGLAGLFGYSLGDAMARGTPSPFTGVQMGEGSSDRSSPSGAAASPSQPQTPAAVQQAINAVTQAPGVPVSMNFARSYLGLQNPFTYGMGPQQRLFTARRGGLAHLKG